MWYLPALFIIYVVIGLLGKVIVRNRDKKICNLIIVLFLFILSSYYDVLQLNGHARQAAKYAFFFMCGFYAKLYWRNVRKLFWMNRFWLCSAAVLAFVIGNVSVNSILGQRIRTCIVDYLIVNIFLDLKFSNRVVNDLIVYIDRNSMAIYLYHPLVMYIMFYLFIESDVSPGLLAAIFIIVCLLLPIIVAKLLRKYNMQWLIGES